MRRRGAGAAGLALLGILVACTGATDPFPEDTPFTPSTPSPTTPSPPTPLGAVRFAAVGDVGDGSTNERRVAEAIARAHAREPLDLLLLLGDLIYPRGNPAEFEQKFAEPYRPVTDAGIELRAALGNHDIQTDREAFLERFRMPGRFYAFSRGPVDFYSVDTSRGAVDDEQLAWLDEELTASTAPWRIVFTHVPLFSSGMHGSNLVLQDQLGNLLATHDVALLLAGHDHNYERTEPIQGTVHVIAGTGCCLRRVGRSAFTERSDSRLSFVLVEATPTEIRLEAVAVDGTVFDRHVIAAAAADAA